MDGILIGLALSAIIVSSVTFLKFFREKRAARNEAFKLKLYALLEFLVENIGEQRVARNMRVAAEAIEKYKAIELYNGRMIYLKARLEVGGIEAEPLLDSLRALINRPFPTKEGDRAVYIYSEAEKHEVKEHNLKLENALQIQFFRVVSEIESRYPTDL